MISTKKVVFVSGSTRGIGKYIVARFLNDGYEVIQNSRNKVEEHNLLSANYIEADVTSYSDCLKISEHIKNKFGRLDVLICNVGSGKKIDSKKTTEETWSHFLLYNLLSTTFLVDVLMPLLLKSKGNVVAVSSICGSTEVKEAPIEYSVAKAALNRYVQTMAASFGNSGVRFNSVAPGNVLFQGSTWDDKLKINSKKVNDFLNEYVPMRTFIQPESIADTIFFLAGDQSKYTTGTIISIDGGQSL